MILIKQMTPKKEDENGNDNNDMHEHEEEGANNDG